MIDREKVIKGLEICSEHGSWHGLDCEHNEAYKDCPYRGCETGCVVTIAKDAIALLKEQRKIIEQYQLETIEKLENQVTSSVKQRDCADIMNKINDALEGTGYQATAFDNTGVWLCVIIEG